MCVGVKKMWGSFPKALQVYLHPAPEDCQSNATMVSSPW